MPTMKILTDSRLRENEARIATVAPQVKWGQGFRHDLALEYALEQVDAAPNDLIVDASRQYITLVYVDTLDILQLSTPIELDSVEALQRFSDRIKGVAVMKNTRKGRNLRMAAWVAVEVAARMIEAQKSPA